MLPHTEESIMISAWPRVNPEYTFDTELAHVNSLIDVITNIRNQKAEAKKAPSHPIHLVLATSDESLRNSFELLRPYLERFVKATDIKICEEFNDNDYVINVLDNVTVFIPQSDLVDKEEVKKQLLEQKAKLEGELKRSQGMLSNPNFINKAPEAKVNAEKEKLNKYQEQYNAVVKHLEELGI